MPRLYIETPTSKLEVEGEESFLREVYSDFRESFMTNQKTYEEEKEEIAPSETNGEKSSPKKRIRKKSNTNSKSNDRSKVKRVTEPQVDTTLPLEGLEAVFEEKKPKGNPQILLVFAAYLRDKHGISPCSVDQLYTCYWAIKTKVKIPAKFRQAIIDTKNKKHWLDWADDNFVTITNIGENAYHHELGGAS